MKHFGSIFTAVTFATLSLIIVASAGFFGTTLTSANAWAGAGGHAGDGLYVHGQLTMRDFIASSQGSGKVTLLSNDKTYLKNVTGFIALIQDIAKADPVFALKIWQQLATARIWVTPLKLPLLPISDTTIVGKKPQVQIAIRDGKDILISTTAFEQLPARERPYELAHEALHGMISDGGLIHQMLVMQMTNYLRDHRGHYVTTDLDDELNKIGIDDTLSEWPVVNKSLADSNRVLEIYLERQGSPSSLCLLGQELNTATYGDTLGYGPDNCSIQNPFTALDDVAPVFQQTDQITNDGNYGYKDGLDDNLDFTPPNPVDLARNRFSKYDCQDNANPNEAGKIEAVRNSVDARLMLAKEALMELTQVRTRFANLAAEHDPALIAAVELFINEPASIGIDEGRAGLKIQIECPYCSELTQAAMPMVEGSRIGWIVDHITDFIPEAQQKINDYATLEKYLQQDVHLCALKYGQYAN